MAGNAMHGTDTTRAADRGVQMSTHSGESYARMADGLV